MACRGVTWRTYSHTHLAYRYINTQGVIEYAKTHVEMKACFLTFQKDIHHVVLHRIGL